ncbi:MAG: aminotransferase class I/II-fold pyridoxal phosphate-dependent enzyme [Ferruginibacter sp.]
MEKKKPHIETIAVHGVNRKGESLGDVIQPIHFSTTYERNKDGSHNAYNYTRAGNPNREAVESKIAALEDAAVAIAFSSGLAAVNAIFENTLLPGSHIIMPDDCYHGTMSLLEKFFKRRNIRVEVTDMTEVLNIEKLIQPDTKLIWIETPSNPQLKIADIPAIVELAKKHGLLTACDNTFATPILQKPLQLGVDYVMHSSTKFFSGHSDILGGIVCTNHRNEITESIRDYQTMAGAVPSPFDCWLLNRSLATFPIRFAAQCSTAVAIAAFLEDHAAVEKVFYPGLVSHTNHALATKQMSNGYGSIISILVKGSERDAFDFAAKLSLFKHATSLGGVSLVEHRRSAKESPG